MRRGFNATSTGFLTNDAQNPISPNQIVSSQKFGELHKF
jgi:hypothetical protein